MYSLLNRFIFILVIILCAGEVFAQGPTTKPPPDKPRTLGTIINNGDGNQEILERCLEFPYRHTFWVEVRLANLEAAIVGDEIIGTLPEGMPPLYLTILLENEVADRAELVEFAYFEEESGLSYYRVFYSYTFDFAGDCRGADEGYFNANFTAVFEMQEGEEYTRYPACSYPSVFSCELFPGPWCDSYVINGLTGVEYDLPPGETCDNSLFRTGETIRFRCGCTIVIQEEGESRIIRSTGSTDVFPNPTDGLVTIPSVDASTVLVMDNMGKVLSANVVDIGGGNWQVDLQDMPKGIYFIRINVPNEAVRLEKVIKM